MILSYLRSRFTSSWCNSVELLNSNLQVILPYIYANFINMSLFPEKCHNVFFNDAHQPIRMEPGEPALMWGVRGRAVYLADDHASCHAQAGEGGEMRGDEKAEACL